MKRLLAPAVIAAAALAVGGIALAARDSDDSDNATPIETSTTTSDSGRESTATVNVMEIEGFGAVLTDAEGRVLYTSDEEAADPDVVCTDACEEFWAPLEAADGTPTAGSCITDVDVAERPDGTSQVTFQGRRLYTFTLEGPGEASGDGFSDTFGDQRFTWHAALAEEANGAATTGAGTDDNSSRGADSDSDVFDYPGY